MEVDPAADVLDDFVLRVERPQGVFLPGEVFLLFLGGDPAVDDLGARLARGGLSSFGELEAAQDVWHAVETLAGSGAHADAAHALGLGPRSQGPVGHGVLGADRLGGDEGLSVILIHKG